MSEEKTFEFTQQTQKKIFAMVLFDEKFLESNNGRIKPSYFDNPVLQDMTKIVIGFYEKYSRIPREDEFREELDAFITERKKREKNFPDHEYLDTVEEIIKIGREGNFDYVKDKIKDFARFRATKQALLGAVDKLERQDYKGIKREIQEAVEDIEDEELQIVCLKDIKAEKIEWLWDKRIPNKKLTLIVGDPETGKSFLSMFLASHVSTGKPLPFSPDVSTNKGEILILTAEDGLEDTVRPRVDLTGGDASKIHIIEGTKRGRYFDLSLDIPNLERTLKLRKNIELLIIDPISAYVGKKSMNNPGEMRELLKPLSALAEKYEFALVCIAHLNKNDSLKAAYRVSGTVGIFAAARSVWLVMKDEEDERDERRYLCCLKMNIAKKPKKAMVFRIWEKENEDPGFEFSDELADIDIGAELTGEAGPVKEAMKLIKVELKSGSRLAREMYQIGKANGIGAKAMRKAAKRSRVTFWQEWTVRGNRWMWTLPANESEEEPEKEKEPEEKREEKRTKVKPKSPEELKKIEKKLEKEKRKVLARVRANIEADKKKKAEKANAEGKE